MHLARYLDSFSLSVLSEISRICKTASTFEKEILIIGRRIVHVLSNMQNVAICVVL